jgi:hypothetical protein
MTQPEPQGTGWPPPTGWSDTLDWWTSPALAYIRGLQDGARLAVEAYELTQDRDWRAACQTSLKWAYQ